MRMSFERLKFPTIFYKRDHAALQPSTRRGLHHNHTNSTVPISPSSFQNFDIIEIPTQTAVLSSLLSIISSIYINQYMGNLRGIHDTREEEVCHRIQITGKRYNNKYEVTCASGGGR